MAKVDVGDSAPDFELPGTGGATFKLSGHRGHNVVLAFYPGDATRVARPSSAPTGTTRIGSTGSTPRSSASPRSRSTRTSAGREKRQLNVPLLADEDLQESYGVTGWGARSASSPARNAPGVAT